MLECQASKSLLAACLLRVVSPEVALILPLTCHDFFHGFHLNSSFYPSTQKTSMATTLRSNTMLGSPPFPMFQEGFQQ
jgi:hypothetical protein